jgi:hypothetical protein
MEYRRRCGQKVKEAEENVKEPERRVIAAKAEKMSMNLISEHISTVFTILSLIDTGVKFHFSRWALITTATNRISSGLLYPSKNLRISNRYVQNAGSITTCAPFEARSLTELTSWLVARAT